MGDNSLYEESMRKRGATFGGWTEAIVFSAVFVILIATVIGGMNDLYSQNHAEDFGFNADGVIDEFTDLSSSLQSGVDSGEADFDSSAGLQISTLWSILKATWSAIGTFITGGWIESAVNLTQLPAILGTALRLLYLISLAFILIKLLLKLKP